MKQIEQKLKATSNKEKLFKNKFHSEKLIHSSGSARIYKQCAKYYTRIHRYTVTVKI